MTKRGKLQRENFNYFFDLMKQIEWDLHQEMIDQKRIPPEWHEIAKAKRRPEKTRLTIRLDADVVRFFRKFGRGYQVRMNDVLATWMHGRLAGVIKGAETEAVWVQDKDDPRPMLGDSELLDRGYYRRADGRLYDLRRQEHIG